MPSKKEPKVTNYVAIEGSYDRPFVCCPACGKKILDSNEKCSHVLFICEGHADRPYEFYYTHPKLKQRAGAVQEAFGRRWQKCVEKETEYAEDSNTFARRLHLDLSRTFILSMATHISSIAGGSDWETVIGIEFPAESEELKRFRAQQSGRSRGRRASSP